MIKIAGVVQPGEPMAGHTSFHIGGPADLFVAPTSAAELDGILATCKRQSVPCFFLGGGTNLLVADNGIRGVVLDVSLLSGMQVQGTLVSALAGTPVTELSQFAQGKGLTGLEFAYALPGSVGGAVWMNARCYEREVSEALEFVDYIDADLTQRRLLMDRREWSYKRSPFQQMRGLILRAGFRLAPGNPERMQSEMDGHREDRVKKGHFLFPCAGSIFKNNRAFGAPTGKLVDSLGLKGRRIGGAQIAPFHGNIIVNTGGASARDVLGLIQLIEEEVARNLGFTLEREVLMVGQF
jgi:UDP-N-acetylmuramate dehydrogenase